MAIDTPLQKAVNMSNDLNNNIFFKVKVSSAVYLLTAWCSSVFAMPLCILFVAFVLEEAADMVCRVCRKATAAAAAAAAAFCFSQHCSFPHRTLLYAQHRYLYPPVWFAASVPHTMRFAPGSVGEKLLHRLHTLCGACIRAKPTSSIYLSHLIPRNLVPTRPILARGPAACALVQAAGGLQQDELAAPICS